MIYHTSPHFRHYHDWVGRCSQPKGPIERSTIVMLAPHKRPMTERELQMLAHTAIAKAWLAKHDCGDSLCFHIPAISLVYTIEAAIKILENTGEYKFATWRL